MWLLRLADLDMPSRSPTRAVVPPRLVFKVPVGLSSCQINVTLCHASFSLIPGQSQCLCPIAFDELPKASHWMVSNSCQRKTLCPQEKMPQRFILRLFAGFKCADFKRGPLLTFESATLRSLLLVISFGGTESTSAAHFLVSVFLSFRARQISLCHLQLMIGFWRVLTSLVVSHRWCQCWCCANWIQVCLASLKSDRLLPYTKGCLDRQFRYVPPKLKSKSSKSESNFFLMTMCTHTFFILLEGFL